MHVHASAHVHTTGNEMQDLSTHTQSPRHAPSVSLARADTLDSRTHAHTHTHTPQANEIEDLYNNVSQAVHHLDQV